MGIILAESTKVAMQAYFEAGLSEKEIAQKCRLNRSTVNSYKRKLVTGQVVSLGNSRDLDIIKKEIGNDFLKTSSNLIKGVTQEKINKAGVSQLMVAAGIAHDHYRIENNLSTQNIAVCLGGLVEKLERERTANYKREKPPF